MNQKLSNALETIFKGADGYSLLELKTAYQNLSYRYRYGESFRFNSPVEAQAYALGRMPATTAALTDVLRHLKPYINDIHSLLDIGCGSGASLWAAQETLLLEKALMLDQSSLFLDLARRLATYLDYSPHLDWRQEQVQTLALSPNSQSDIVILSYVLNELSAKTQDKLLKTAWDHTHQFLVLVEPGTPKGFEHIHKARQFLIQENASILAPCTHEQSCPLAPSLQQQKSLDWCHFKVRVGRSPSHKRLKGVLSFEDEKYCYLIASKKPLENKPWGRIIKNPRHYTGWLELEVCTKEGLIQQKVTKKNKSLYKTNKKLKWGEGINV